MVCNYGKASLLRVPAPTGTRSYGKTAVPVVYSTASILYVQYVVDLRCQYSVISLSLAPSTGTTKPQLGVASVHNMKFVAARPCLHASTAAALERHCHGAPRAPLHAVWAGGRWPAMGKCYKCTSAQASYYDPDNGPGRYCKQCAKTVPGAVSRWQKDKQKAAAAATEAAAALATVGDRIKGRVYVFA